MKRRGGWKLLSLVLAIGTASAGCDLVVPWDRLYRGDGEYLKAPGMYQVRLGVVPHAIAEREFVVRNLGPEWGWTLGLRVESSMLTDDDLIEPGTTDLETRFVPRGVVAVTVLNDRQEIVVAERGSLEKWEWNWNHAARRGDGHDYQAAPSTFKFRRLGTKGDGGWGSEFTPRYRGVYRIRYQVLEAAQLEPGIQLWLTLEAYLGSL